MITGQPVKITFKGRTLDGRVEMGSNNRRSLMLMFDGILGGYLMRMPVYMDEKDVYRELLGGEEVTIEFLPVGAEFIAAELTRIFVDHPNVERITIHIDPMKYGAADAEKTIRDLLTPADNERVEILIETPRMQ